MPRLSLSFRSYPGRRLPPTRLTAEGIHEVVDQPDPNDPSEVRAAWFAGAGAVGQNALQWNTALAQRAQDRLRREEAEALDERHVNPLAWHAIQTVRPDPQWDAFFEALRETGASISGGGRSPPGSRAFRGEAIRPTNREPMTTLNLAPAPAGMTTAAFQRSAERAARQAYVGQDLDRLSYLTGALPKTRAAFLDRFTAAQRALARELRPQAEQENRAMPRESMPATVPGSLERAVLLAALREAEAMAEERAARAQEARQRARLASPLEAAYEAERVRQFHERRDVMELPEPGAAAAALPPLRVPRMLTPDTTREFGTAIEQGVRAVKGARRVTEGPPAARRIRRFGTAPTLTEQTAEAARYGDPNYPRVYAGREAETRLAPRADVLAAEATATGRVNTKQAAAIDAAAQLERHITDVLEYGRAQGWPGVGGLGRGTLSRVGKQQLGVGEDVGETMRNMIGNLRADIGHEKYGSAFTRTERAMLDTFAPSIDRSPRAIETNLVELQRLARQKREALEGGGPPERETVPATAPGARIRQGRYLIEPR